MKDKAIAIIGSGVSGLACAVRLKEAGVNPTVYDKGRNIGGRTATRKSRSGLQFDHGAQYVTARSPAFRQVLARAQNSGKVGEWDFGNGVRFVGLPGMNGLAEFLGEGLNVRQNAEVTSIHETSEGWSFRVGDEILTAEKLVLTVPAPQAVALLGGHHPLSEKLHQVAIQPCLTLMVTFDGEVPARFTARRDNEDPISWIALDSSKPLRTTRSCWVAQASPDWSATFLEETPSLIAERMLPLVCDRLGVAVSSVTHAVAHRWRYAAVSNPLGSPFLKTDNDTLYLGGDWCLDARVEAAWTSGTAIAADIVEDL